jgi:hypothetical protein
VLRRFEPSRRRVPGSSPRPKSSFRWDTVAAVASAIGAIASAAVAIYALRYASNQEEIARKQLQATYTSNLYSRQIDNLAALDAELVKFVDGQYKTKELMERPTVTSQLTSDILRGVLERAKSYDKEEYVSLFQRSTALSLVMPGGDIKNAIFLPTLAVLTEVNVITTILESETLEPEKMLELASTMRSTSAKIYDWRAHVLGCLSSPLSNGIPVPRDQISKCHLSLDKL